MGGGISTGKNNDELVDNLLATNYIKTSTVERTFRAVDRGAYYLPECRKQAYKDFAWKSGNLHISAPGIYTEVMESLNLTPGLSFLNLGSGTGYLSTMVGLILGSRGINHGIEIHEDVIQFAYKKLEEFRKYSGAIDEYDFCEPKFIQGNCLCLSSDIHQYDRIYCGAACPEPYDNYIKNLLKVGGILVMPFNDQLLKIKRTSETNWERYVIFPVSFATLIKPKEEKQDFLSISVELPSLQAMCRTVVRNTLRKKIEQDYPNLKYIPTVKERSNEKVDFSRFQYVSTLTYSDESSEEEDDEPTRVIDLGTHWLGRHRRRSSESDKESDDDGKLADNEYHEIERNLDLSQVKESDEIMDVDSAMENNENQSKNVDAIIEHPISNINEIKQVIVGVLSRINKGKSLVDELYEDIEEDTDEEVKQLTDAASDELEKRPDVRGANIKHQKFDSGLGEDLIEKDGSGTSDMENLMEVDSFSSTDEDNDERPSKRSSIPQTEVRTGNKWRRITLSSHKFDSKQKAAGQDEERPYCNEFRTVWSPYTSIMKNKIFKLPLPPSLQHYLNFYRDT